MNLRGPALRILVYAAGLLILLPVLLVACQGEKISLNLLTLRQPEATPFIPPTVSAPTPLVSSVRLAATEVPPLPTAVPSCVDSLSFYEDLSIPDGTVVSPGQRLDKRWKVSNSGACNWDERYRLKLIAGPDMGASQEQALYPARSGAQATIRILFKAPNEPGTYRSAWQASNPQGEPFGDTIYIEIVVK